VTNSIPKPEISPNFTIDDIHKIREWHYESRKGMTRQEVIDHINRRGAEFEALVDAVRQRKAKSHTH
jgi:predicted secreted protein